VNSPIGNFAFTAKVRFDGLHRSILTIRRKVGLGREPKRAGSQIEQVQTIPFAARLFFSE
jgi:hypothetical protein